MKHEKIYYQKIKHIIIACGSTIKQFQSWRGRLSGNCYLGSPAALSSREISSTRPFTSLPSRKLFSHHSLMFSSQMRNIFSQLLSGLLRVSSSFSVFNMLKFQFQVMLERKDKMRVCLISLTYLSTQISNFCDTLAILLLSRLSLTALSNPLFFSTSGCLH